MTKSDVIEMFSNVMRNRSKRLKEFLDTTSRTSLDEISYKNELIECDKEYIEDLENLINDIVKKFDEDKIAYKVCKNCKHFNQDPYISNEGICNFINRPVPTLTKPNRTCSSFTSRKY